MKLGFMGFGETLFGLLPARIYGVAANYQWLAIPLFVFMGVMLEKSKLAEDLLALCRGNARCRQVQEIKSRISRRLSCTQ